jgi:hypothetical protein
LPKRNNPNRAFITEQTERIATIRYPGQDSHNKRVFAGKPGKKSHDRGVFTGQP